MFRTSESYLDRYFQQVKALEDAVRPLGYDLRLILVEGDSADNTFEELHRLSEPFEAEIIKREHGGPAFQSIVNEQRWRQISYATNGALEAVKESDDYFVWVEADLIWEPGVMCDLLRHLERGTPAVSPLCIGPDGLFHDVWAYRKDGEHFQKPAPFHPGVNGKLTEIDSAGSCIAMRSDIAMTCRYDPPERCVLSFCEGIYEMGYSLVVDPLLRVYHP
jgi:hypothetical protein